MPKRKNYHKLTASAGGNVALQKKDGSAFTMLLYAGRGMLPEGFKEEVILDLEGLELPLDKRINVLVDHQNKLDAVAGRGTVSIKDGQLYVDGETTTATGAGRTIRKLLAEHQPLQASVGCDKVRLERLDESRVINGNRVPSNTLVVVSARLREATIVSLGGDADTAVLAASLHIYDSKKRKKKAMKTELKRYAESLGMDPETMTAKQTKLLKAAYKKHTADTKLSARLSAIDVEYSDDLTADQITQLRATAASDGWDVDRYELEARRAARPPGQLFSAGNGSTSNANGNPADMITAALCMRFPNGGEVVEAEFGKPMLKAAGDLSKQRLTDIIKHGLTAHGMRVGSSPDDVLKASVSGASPINTPQVLADTLNRVLVNMWKRKPVTSNSFARVVNVNDFRDTTEVRLNDVGELKKVNRGEIKGSTLVDANFKYAVETYATVLNLDRVQIINDDLGAFTQIPQIQLSMYRRTLLNLHYSTLFGGVGSGFWDANNGNYLTDTAGALTIDNLGVAVSMMRNQVDDLNQFIDVVPSVLVVGPSEEVNARQILNSIEVSRNTTSDDNLPTGNPFNGMSLKLEIEPRMESTDHGGALGNWLLAAGADSADAVMVQAFLQGNKIPKVESFGYDQDVNTLAMSWRLYTDIGSARAIPQGGVLSVPTAPAPVAASAARKPAKRSK